MRVATSEKILSNCDIVLRLIFSLLLCSSKSVAVGAEKLELGFHNIFALKRRFSTFFFSRRTCNIFQKKKNAAVVVALLFLP